MRNAGIAVNTDWEEGERVLQQENGISRMVAVDRTTDEYKQKVSDAEQRIESRLAELNRSMVEKQSPKSDYGNSDGSMPEDISSVIDGDTVSRAQSVASDAAKLQNNSQNSKENCRLNRFFSSQLVPKSGTTLAKSKKNTLSAEPAGLYVRSKSFRSYLSARPNNTKIELVFGSYCIMMPQYLPLIVQFAPYSSISSLFDFSNFA